MKIIDRARFDVRVLRLRVYHNLAEYRYNFYDQNRSRFISLPPLKNNNHQFVASIVGSPVRFPADVQGEMHPNSCRTVDRGMDCVCSPAEKSFERKTTDVIERGPIMVVTIDRIYMHF
jgi:hypothetical protein